MPSTISDFLSQLRFPYLFVLTAGIFFLDLLVPDVVPFADEILLGLEPYCCRNSRGSKAMGRDRGTFATRPGIPLAALVLLTAYTTASGPAKEAPGDTALKKWLGMWNSQIEIRPAAWSVKFQKLSGTVKAEWILNGRYQQISSHAGEYETRELQRYESKSGKYHKWVFSSDGSNSFWSGAWEDESATMTWEYVDFGAGLKARSWIVLSATGNTNRICS